MKIKQTSAVDRVYKWWYMEKYEGHLPQYVNLCPYLRAVLLWAPLRFLFLSRSWLGVPLLGVTIGAIESVGWAEVIYLLRVYGLREEIPIIAAMFIFSWFLVHVIGITILSAWAYDMYKSEDGFIHDIKQLVTAKAHAAHESICPMLERELQGDQE